MSSRIQQIRPKIPSKFTPNTTQQTIVWQPLPPMVAHLNSLMQTLNDAPQDDVKFQALKEISENMEELFGIGTHPYTPLVESLIRLFMKLLNETTPQFISENNTLKLRKLIFELLYRLSSNEIMKSYSKTWQQILLRLIHSENEENALLIIKILTDHIKTFRPPFSNELTAFFVQWKNAYNEMLNRHMAANDGATMFLQRSLIFSNKSIEDSVVEALKTCYFTTPLSLSASTSGAFEQFIKSYLPFPNKKQYTLIPRASQSVKVLAEITILLLALIQFHRQQLLGELLDIVPIFVRYINVDIARAVREDNAFHRELVDEFRNSQVRALSIIAYIARQAQMTDVMNAHSQAICQGILMLFDSFHDEVITQRRDLLLAIKYFFQSEFRHNFIPVIPKMCNEKTLLGNTFTSQDQLRNQAYFLLADILHHVRMNLGDLLMHDFFLCSRNLHDPQLLPYVQTMYGKLMMNLIEPLVMQAKEGEGGEEFGKMQRQILCCAIDSFVRKATLIAEWHLPHLMEKYKQQTPQPQPATLENPQTQNAATYKSNEQTKSAQSSPMKGSPQKSIKTNFEGSPQKLVTSNLLVEFSATQKSSSSPFDASQAFWQDPLYPLSLNDGRNMVRNIILPTKMLVIALKELGNQLGDSNCLYMVENQLTQLFASGLKCLDIFMIGSNTGLHGQNPTSTYPQKFGSGSTSLRSKEERDTIEAFMNIFTNIDAAMFEEIMEKHIELLMERMIVNPVLQNVCNQFFSHPQTLRKMGVILVKYLLNKLSELGANNDRAFLYLKMFQLIFQSLSYTANPSNSEQIQTLTQNCDIILKPYLHRIVQNSMHLAISSRESTNYFRLLRSLFRSIGNGTHDHLYQQFLPLLPSILQKLNCLQNGSHRQPIHELFVELCLTIPVRLSTLLPYLPMLMDPLVCALNGSPTLVQQGLRTLELCVDNLQPDYFYEQMQPVRAALMKGLWRCVSTADTQLALIALRILGKFGNISRKVLMDAQTMEWRMKRDQQGIGPKLLAKFEAASSETMAMDTGDEQSAQMERMSLGDAEMMVKSCKTMNAHFTLDGCVQSAIAILRVPDAQVQHPSASSSTTTPSTYSGTAKMQACEFIKTLLVGLIPTSQMCSESAMAVAKLIQTDGITFSNYICPDNASRQTIISALNGLFIAVFNVETRQQILPFFRALIKHLTIQCVLESVEDDNQKSRMSEEAMHLDSLVLIDAIALTLSDSCKDYCHTAILALRILIDTASSLFNNDWVKAAQMPLFEYMVEKITALCYRREWFARLGGCTAMRLIIEIYPPCFVKRNMLTFLDGCIHTISFISGELSCGTFEFASISIDLIVNICFGPNEPHSQGTLLAKFIEHLADEIDDPEPILRNECIRVINATAKRIELPLSTILQTSKHILESKLVEGMQHFPAISIQCKIAIIDLYLFYAKIGDDFNLNIPEEINATFAQNLLKICQQTNADELRELLKIQQIGSTNGMDFGKNGNSMEVEEKLRTIRKTSNEALVNLYFNIYAQNKEGKILQQIFQHFVDFSLENCNTELTEDITVIKSIVDLGITEILQKFPDNFKLRYHFNNKFAPLVSHFRDKKTFISDTFFKKLTFLIKHLSREISEDVVKRLKDDLSLIMQTSPASLNSDDVECVVNAVQLFHQSKHYKDEKLVQEFFQFFTQTINQFPSKMKIQWQNSITPFLLHCPSIVAEIILKKRAFCQENSKQFVHSLIETDGEEASQLRRALLQNASLLKIVDDELVMKKSTDSKPDATFELNLLKFLSTLLDKEYTMDMEENLLPIFSSIRALWASNSFKQRHSVRNTAPEKMGEGINENLEQPQQPTETDSTTAMDTTSAGESASFPPALQKEQTPILDECKFDTPAFCAKILLVRLRFLLLNFVEKQKENTEDVANECVDLLYELTFAFVHEYASDIIFLRKFIDDEIIPKLPLHWRRLCFFKVIKLLRADPANGHSLHLVRFIQYIVAPIFAYAFEIYDTDLVVMGEETIREQQQQSLEAQSTGATDESLQQKLDEQNIVAVFCNDVIQRLTNDKNMMSHTLTIVMYLFSALLVQKCPMHIYDTTKKPQEQGNLRPFMLFGWPCLSKSFTGDMTEKYAGHFLIANIIDQFTINRTIILQVLSSLMYAHHQDNREMIRKSLDILIPAVPRRMAEGHSQLLIYFKKALVEECRNCPQINHCLQIIVRHHTVFYHIRHQIIHLILGSMQRLLQMQGGYETKRLLLDVCEVMIKWEQERQTALQTMEASGAIGTAGGNGESTEAAQSTPSMSATAPSSSTSVIVPDVQMQPAAADLHKQMDKAFIDNIILFLFRIATSTDQIGAVSSSGATAMEQINKRAVMLLRNALKPNIFGGVATIRTHLLEKQLQLPNPEQFSTGNEVAINHQLQMVNMTLEVLSNLINYLAPQILLELFIPLQRALICCMNYNNSQQILRATYPILVKLLDKSKSSATGLDEFEQLNLHITRCIHDAMNNYASTLTSSPPMNIINLFRLMHTAHPAYLDTVCLNPFIKLLQRLVREYVFVPSHGASTIDQAQKLNGDLLAICLEVIYTRTKHFNVEAQKNVVQFVLLPLIEKNAGDKILEYIVKISLEIVKSEIAQAEILKQSTMGGDLDSMDAPSSAMPIQSQGGHVLLKFFQSLDQRLMTNVELRRQFLLAILTLYEHQELLAINLGRLQLAFYWGLCTSDREIRNRYFVVFEKQFPKTICARIIHIMSKENWEPLGASFWLTHVVHLLLLSANLEQRIRLVNCAKFANLIEFLAPKIVDGGNGQEEAENEIKMETEEGERMEEGGQEELELAPERMETGEEERPIATEEEEAIKAPNESLMDEQMDEDGGGGEGEEGPSSQPEQQPSQLMNLPSTQSGSQQSLLRPNSREQSMMRISFSEIGGPVEETASKKTTLEKNVAEIQNTLISFAKEAKFRKIVTNLMGILYTDPALCNRVFVELFSSLWLGFDEEERNQITPLITPFLTSATLLQQQQQQREMQSPQQYSVVASFLEAFIRCTPQIPLDPFVLSYIGSNHRCWHLAMLLLEQMATGIKLNGDQSLINPINWPEEKVEVLDSLAQLYRQLNELDQFTHIWKRRAFFDKTIKCFTLYQQGDFLRARETAEKLIAHLNEKLTGKGLSAAEIQQQQQNFTTIPIQKEWHEIEQCWINSCKQLNDWRAVEKFAGSEDVADAPQLVDALWHLNEWRLLKDCLVQVDAAANPRTQIQSTLLKLMTNIANFDQQEHRLSKDFTDKSLYEVNRALCREWRRLPPAVTHSHVQILYRAHLALEVQESTSVLLSNLQSVNFPTASNTTSAGGNGSQNGGSGGLNQDVKKLIKSWGRNRSIAFVDQLDCWQAPYTWRCQFFSALLRFYESTDQKTALSIPHHAIAQTQLEFMRTLRHSNQIDTALGEMNKMHSTPMVHPMDAHSKLVEHIKCLLKLSSGDPGCGSKRAAQDGLVEALDMIEGTQFQLLKRDQIAQLMVYKGILLSRLEKRDEAGKAFSTAAQLDQNGQSATSSSTSIWKHWGDFLINSYLVNSTPNATTTLNVGIQAIACTLEHARTVGPQKARASIAKLLWLIKIACGTSNPPTDKVSTAVDKVSAAIDEQLKDAVDSVPPANWIFWLNSIVADVGQRSSCGMLEILNRLGKTYPQQVFCALRLELGPEKVNECMEKFLNKQKLLQIPSDEPKELNENRLISALESLCEHSLGDMDMLNKILNELDSFTIGPTERTLYDFKQILAQCHFDQFTKIAELTTINAEPTLVKRLYASIRSLSREIGTKNQICIELYEDFGITQGTKIPPKSLHKFTSALRKWIPRLCDQIHKEIVINQSQKLSMFGSNLSRFKSSVAKIDIFDGQCSEFGHPNPQIAQFLPIYEQYIQNESVCRLIRIRSLNGKIYSYQLERLIHSTAANSQSHIFQLFTLLNNEFTKSMNTAQRHLQFAIPRIQITGPNCRLIQCCPSAGISSQFQNANSDHSAENFAIFSDILGEMLGKGDDEGENVFATDNSASQTQRQYKSPLAIVDCYYNRLAEQRYSHKTIHELFNQISTATSNNDANANNRDKFPANFIFVQRDLLSRWMNARYPNPTSLWIARKKMALHFALLGLSEHTFFLSPMMPDGLVLDLSTGQLFFTDYKFDLTKKIGSMNGKVRFIELDANRPVPFRLTSNISHFLAPSIEGHLNGALTAIARSFSARTLECWLRPILWDVFVKVAAEDGNDQQKANIANPVKRAVDTILTRVKAISNNENGMGPTSNLLIQAQLPDNLCRMDPNFHPWF